MQNKIYGWKKQKEDVRDFKFTHNFTVENLPSSTDLRPKMPPVYDQGQLGSCTANSIAGLVEYDNPNLTPSRLFIYYNERAMEGTISQDAGANIRDGIKTINTIGVCSEKTVPYDITKFAKKPTKKAFTEALKNKSVKYYAVNQTELDIIAALASGFPIAFGFEVKQSFESAEVAKTGIYQPKAHETILGGHAVEIAGNDGINRMFLIRNSWGTGWGLQGYFWMSYEEVLNAKVSSDFWVINAMQ